MEANVACMQAFQRRETSGEAKRRETSGEAKRRETSGERAEGEKEVLSLPLPVLLAARFASPLVSRRWNACMQAKANADREQAVNNGATQFDVQVQNSEREIKVGWYMNMVQG